MKLRLMTCAMVAGAALFANEPTDSATYGVLAVSDSASSNIVVGVPWLNVGTGNVTISNLISTATLDTGDGVYLYENDAWLGYTLNSSGDWVAATTVGGTSIVTPDEAYEKVVARGTGLIIQHVNTNAIIYLCGRYTNETITTTITANSLTLIANPTTSAKTIGDGIGTVGDQIRVPKNGGDLLIYEKRSDGWGTEVVTKDTSGKRPRTIRTWTLGCELAPGMGAWYKCGATGTSIEW